MKFQDTHFERCSAHAAWAKSLLERQGFDKAFTTALEERPLSATVILREHIRPVSHMSFQEVTKTPQFADIHSFVESITKRVEAYGGPPSVQGEVITQSVMAWHTARFDERGRQTYVPTPALSRLLLATELRGLRCADMTLPYPSVYLSVDPALGFKVHNETTGEHPLYGMYITDDSSTFTDENGEVYDNRHGWRVMLCGDRSAASKSEWDDALSHFYIDLSNDDRSMAEVVTELFGIVRAKGPEWCRQQGMGDQDLDAIVDAWEASFKWAMNLMFYVTRPDFKDLEHVEANPEAAALWRRAENAPKGSKKRDRIRDQYRGTPKRPRIVVGRRVVSDDRLPKTVGEAIRALRVRTLVPAHWQRYRTGAGRTETVWKQKAPFWRGPDDVDPRPEQVHEVL